MPLPSPPLFFNIYIKTTIIILVLQVACFFPGIAFFCMLVINIFLWHTGSSGAIPFLVFFTLIFLWFALSVPLSLVGGYMAAKQPPVEMPTRTNQIPRQVCLFLSFFSLFLLLIGRLVYAMQIPEQRFSALALIVGAGILPFGTMFIELYFIMSSIWMHHTYYVFGFLLIVLVFLAIICAEVSIVLTYVQLCAEDYRWMWRAFVSSVWAHVFQRLCVFCFDCLVIVLCMTCGRARSHCILSSTQWDI